MGERDDNEVGGSSQSLPTSAGSSKKPTIIRPRPASKSTAVCPPRPESTPHLLSGSPIGLVKPPVNQARSKKPEITLVDARPLSELGSIDMKSSFPTSVSNHPASPGGGTFTHNTSVKEQQHGNNPNKTDLTAGGGGDHDDDDDRVVVRKPSLQLRPQKPTIIRPQSRLQSCTDQTPVTESTAEPAQKNQSNSPAPPSSISTILPSLPAHPPPNPKLRLKDSSTISSDPQIQFATEKKPLPTPPARPPSICGQGLPSQKSPVGQPLATKVSLATDDRTPSPNPSSPVTTPSKIQPPKRPLGPPRPNLPGSHKAKDQIEVNAKSVTETESQISHTVQISIDSHKDTSLSGVVLNESDSHKKDNSENKSVVPKPKPRPKPRPISLTSPGVKEEAQAAPSDSVDSSINKQLSLFNQSLQNTSNDIQQKVLEQKSKPSPATTPVDKICQEKHSSTPERPKPLSTNVAAKTETSRKVEDDVKPLPTAPSSNKKSGPVVHASPSDRKPTPLSQLPSITSGEPNVMPSPPRRVKHQASAQQNPALQVNPPLRPATSAPAKSKPTFVSEKQPESSNSSLSSLDVDRAEMAKSSKPKTSRVKQQTGPPPLPNRPAPNHPLYSYVAREPHGIALHDYTASQPDELSFFEGDVVILLKEIDENWSEGQVGDSVGLFPTTFVEIRCPLKGQKSKYPSDSLDSGTTWGSSKNNLDIMTGPRCRARFDFEGDEEGELTLEDGDVVQIVDKVGDEWLRGKHRGRQGIFPTSFVEIIEDLQPEGSIGDNMFCNVSALFDFDGKSGELTFKAGDTISVISQVNSEWLFGHCNGQKGQFPANFVSGVPANLPKYELDLPAQEELQQKQKAEQNGNTKERKVSSVPGEEFWESKETGLGFCIAMYDFTDPSPGDLEFKKSDRIEILEFIGEDWARGRLRNKEGLFPLRFVAEELNSPPRTPEPEVVPKILGKVLHDFDGETADDLVIKEGDLIEVGDFADINKNWRWGTLNGKKGMFPATFVDILE